MTEPEPVVVPAALDGERVDHAVALLTGYSRAEVQALLRGGAVLVGGEPVAKSRKVRQGEVVEVLAAPPSAEPPAADPTVPVHVIDADTDVIVIDKAAGQIVHPGAGHPDDTLVNGLLARFPELADVGDPARPGIVHRLDRDTSGLMLVARTTRAYDALVDALAARAVERIYLALVWGRFDASRGLIDAPIGRSVRRPTRMTVRDGGREARTGYAVLEVFERPEVSLLECRLETGRTHQIRVHLAAVGHPVVGDAVYGGARRGLAPGRPFLHAARIAFVHPGTEERHTYEVPLPPELQIVLDDLRAART